MKKLFFSILFLLTVSLKAQQQIKLCDENTTFTYTTSTTSTNLSGEYIWSINGIIYPSTASSITIDWNSFEIGQYTIIVEFLSETGCQSLPLTYNINLLECDNTTIWVPNSFTPNGDGKNDLWAPVGYNYKSVNYLIYNRWGQLIFESKKLNSGWDGKYLGKDCQQGVYLYVLIWTDTKNIEYRKHGHFTLLR